MRHSWPQVAVLLPSDSLACSPFRFFVVVLVDKLYEDVRDASQYDCRVHAQLDLLPHVGERAGRCRWSLEIKKGKGIKSTTVPRLPQLQLVTFASQFTTKAKITTLVIYTRVDSQSNFYPVVNPFHVGDPDGSDYVSQFLQCAGK